MFGMFSNTLNEAMKNTGLFEVFLHCTYTDKLESPCGFVDDCANLEAQSAVLGHVVSGRPNLDKVCASVPSGADTLIMACGPESMINSASEVAYKRGFTFHSEIFHF